MRENEQPQVLTVGCDGVPENGPSFFAADNGKRALELLRMLRFDLVVTRSELTDGPAWNLIRKIKAAWPWQKWALVAGDCSPQDEIAARTLGVTTIFDAEVNWDDVAALAGSFRKRIAVAPAANVFTPEFTAVAETSPTT